MSHAQPVAPAAPQTVTLHIDGMMCNHCVGRVKAALEALNAGEAALYRVNTALGSKAGKALDRETRTKIKEAERTLERVLKHKKADNLTPVDVKAINNAREALSAVAAPLVARWESEKA